MIFGVGRFFWVDPLDGWSNRLALCLECLEDCGPGLDSPRVHEIEPFGDTCDVCGRVFYLA